MFCNKMLGLKNFHQKAIDLQEKKYLTEHYSSSFPSRKKGIKFKLKSMFVWLFYQFQLIYIVEIIGEKIKIFSNIKNIKSTIVLTGLKICTLERIPQDEYNY